MKLSSKFHSQYISANDHDSFYNFITSLLKFKDIVSIHTFLKTKNITKHYFYNLFLYFKSNNVK